ncbi:DNA cytosine methyltransferase, partial [Pseudoflavonifractor sp. 524-17]|uniref:DNA cytosine methyltransferase n=1 Tax=Pseudoflavonifractor sp. 524-17 TaxID=2304577 RepID=UPI00325B84E7
METAVRHAVCRRYEQKSLLEAVRQIVREELHNVEVISAKEKQSSRRLGTWMRTSLAFCCLYKTIEVKHNLIRYFDMFAGSGGFRAGLDCAGGFQCVGHCEIDKYADASYRAIHNIREEEKYYPDARTIDPDCHRRRHGRQNWLVFHRPVHMVCPNSILPEACKSCLFFFLRNLFYL